MFSVTRSAFIGFAPQRFAPPTVAKRVPTRLSTWYRPFTAVQRKTKVVIRHQGAVAKTRILMQADASGSDAPVSDSKDEIVKINGAIQNTKSLPVALKLVEDMSAASIPPNEQTYVSLILVCRKQRQAERALVVYEAMKAVGVQPSLKTYNLLLR
ncbi:hypothetical protein CYMTET_33767, partial [Cymbomonas tetramitiformis]